jgi:hypothetical protein
VHHVRTDRPVESVRWWKTVGRAPHPHEPTRGIGAMAEGGRSCTTSARTDPCDLSTRSSTFARNGSINCSRRPDPVTGRPASRAAMYERTVLGSTPASRAAEGAHPVASNASKLFMISLSDFLLHSPSGRCRQRGDQRPRSQPPEGSLVGRRHDPNRAAGREISCPRKGRSRVRPQGGCHVRSHGVPASPDRSSGGAPAMKSDLRDWMGGEREALLCHHR